MEQAEELLNFKLGRQAKIDLSIQSNYFYALYLGVYQPWETKQVLQFFKSCQNTSRDVIYVVVKFYPWFKFYFPLFQTHHHTLQYPKTKENKIWTKDKI